MKPLRELLLEILLLLLGPWASWPEGYDVVLSCDSCGAEFPESESTPMRGLSLCGRCWRQAIGLKAVERRPR